MRSLKLRPIKTRKPTQHELQLFYYFDELRWIYKETYMFLNPDLMIGMFYIKDPQFIKIFNIWLANQNDHRMYPEIYVLNEKV